MERITMKTLPQIREELEADQVNTTLTKLVNGESITCTADERAAIIDERAQTLFDRQQLQLTVSFRALAFVLLEAGLYEQVKTAAMATPAGEIWWNTAQSNTVSRQHPFVAALGAAIGQTSEQLDTIFAAAALQA
jgi:hypothetical protein